MMDVLMGMKDAEGMLITSPIVAEDEIKLITSLGTRKLEPLPPESGRPQRNGTDLDSTKILI